MEYTVLVHNNDKGHTSKMYSRLNKIEAELIAWEERMTGNGKTVKVICPSIKKMEIYY